MYIYVYPNIIICSYSFDMEIFIIDEFVSYK